MYVCRLGWRSTLVLELVCDDLKYRGDGRAETRHCDHGDQRDCGCQQSILNEILTFRALQQPTKAA